MTVRPRAAGPALHNTSQGDACNTTTDCHGQSNCHGVHHQQLRRRFLLRPACQGQCRERAASPSARPSSRENAPRRPTATRRSAHVPSAAGTAPCIGTCDGVATGACTNPTIQCTPQTCSGGVVTFATACKNGGCAAPTPATQSCTSGFCDTVNTTTCKSGCTSDGQCSGNASTATPPRHLRRRTHPRIYLPSSSERRSSACCIVATAPNARPVSSAPTASVVTPSAAGNARRATPPGTVSRPT